MEIKLKKLSCSELEFMQYLWNGDDEKNIQDFVDHFADKDWERSTISVFLHRLTQKGYLTYRQDGRSYYYRPLVTRMEYEQGIISHELKRTFGKPLEHVIAAFCGKAKDDQQIERIKEFLKELEEENK